MPVADWEDGSNWAIPAGSEDFDGGLHFFNKTGGDVAYDWRPFAPSGPDSVAVWFRVYAFTEALPLGAGGFDPINDPSFDMGLRGSSDLMGTQNGQVIDWGASNIDLRREGTSGNGFQIFSGRVAYPNSSIGMDQLYKFVAQDGSGNVGWENVVTTFPDNNRGFTLPAQDTTLYLKYFGDAPPVLNPPVTQTVVFSVDAQPLADVGIFSRSRGDSLQVRGGFNGWDCNNADDCELVRVGGSEIYRRGVPFTASNGASFTYKYLVDLEIDFAGITDPNDISNFGYEEPLDVGGGDRTFLFDGSQTNQLGPQFFNSIRPGNVIPGSAGPITVAFEVNMNPARGFQNGNPFTPSEDTVYVNFEDKPWQLTQGFTPAEIVNDAVDFALSDPDGDGIYTGTFALQTPTYNGVGYRYAYGSAGADELVFDGQGGFAAGRRRYRYVLPNANGSFPSSFQFARDVFRPSDVLSPFEANPTDPDRDAKIAANPDLYLQTGAPDPFTTAIEEVPGEVAEAAQAVVFPNPVAGTATIRYDVPQAGAVSLRVYDLVGREVAVLVDGEQAAAKYDATFEASRLAPGVYVYRLQAAGQLVSGKLTVIR